MALVRELKIFFGIIIVAALGMHHKEFLSHPLEHIMALPSAGAFGIGMIHPIVFGLIIYLLAWLPRLIVNKLTGNKKAPDENI